MKVSVIIPSFNHCKFISSSVESVLLQDYQNIELLVIDDGSSDESPELLKRLQQRFSFELILKKNEGVCATLNRGIKKATGDYITFLASDDLMTEGRLTQQVKFMEKNPQIDVAAGQVKFINESGEEISSYKTRVGLINFEEMIQGNKIFTPTAIYRPDVFREFGFYPEHFKMEDYYMWLKILSQGGRIYNTNYVWAYYRKTDLDLERKFRSYHFGIKQILSEYSSIPAVRRELAKQKRVYNIKMSLLIGSDFFKEDSIRSLPAILKFFLFFIAYSPELIRKKTLSFLLK